MVPLPFQINICKSELMVHSAMLVRQACSKRFSWNANDVALINAIADFIQALMWNIEVSPVSSSAPTSVENERTGVVPRC